MIRSSSVPRIADQCRQRAAEDRFLRRFGMGEPAGCGDGDDDAGPGWYASSRELEAGLLVREDDDERGLAEWHEAMRRFVPPRLASA